MHFEICHQHNNLLGITNSAKILHANDKRKETPINKILNLIDYLFFQSSSRVVRNAKIYVKHVQHCFKVFFLPYCHLKETLIDPSLRELHWVLVNMNFRIFITSSVYIISVGILNVAHAARALSIIPRRPHHTSTRRNRVKRINTCHISIDFSTQENNKQITETTDYFTAYPTT